MSLSQSDRRKLIGLLGQMGHDNINVRAASGAAAERLIKAAGLTWENIVIGEVVASSSHSVHPADEDNCTIGDVYSAAEFEEILADAEDAAETDWEVDFIESIAVRYRKYRLRTKISPKQWSVIERLAGIA